MGHSDVVTVDEAKWKFPPFSATRDGGWVYARGTVDDKDNLTGGLMTMLLLKRFNVPLDRDVIFLSEAGEEGSSNFGMQFMVSQHYPEIESEYCLAEGGGAIRIGGVAKYTTVETLEKIPRESNTVPQMQSSLTSIFSLEIDPREAALRETEEAIGLVLNRSEAVELSPQNAYIRRLQHQMAERANLVSRSRGREPYRRVRLYPDAARSAWR